MITSVEYVNLNMTGTTASIALSKGQTIANCVPFSSIHGDTGTGGKLYNFFTDVWFTDAGTPTVNIQRGSSGGTLDVGIFVVEFDPAEITVQQGSYSFSSTSTTAAITGVNLSKAAMVHHFRTSTSSDSWYYHPTRCKFNSTTQVGFQRGAASGSVTGHWYVFEDTEGTNFRVQTLNTNFSGGSTNPVYNYTIRDRTFILTSYYSNESYSAWAQRGSIRSYIYDDHGLILDRSDGANTIYATTFVIDFLDNTKAYVQHWWVTGSNNGSTVTYMNQLDYPVDLDSSMVIFPQQGGMNRQNGTDLTDNYGIFWHVNFTSASGIQLDRQPPNDYGYCFYQVIDWNGYITFDGTGTNPTPITDELIISIEEVEIELGNAYDGRRIASRFGWKQLTKGQDVDNCVIFSSYRVTGGSGYFYEVSAVVGFDGSRVFAHRANNDAGTFTMHAFVVEFNPTKVNVVHGYHYFSGTSSNKTIPTLTDYTKAFLISNWWSACGQNNYYFYIRNRLTSNTNIEYARGGASNYVNIYYFVVEDIGDNWTVQTKTNSFGTSSYTNSSLSFVPWNNTFSITSHYTNETYIWPQRSSIRHYHYNYNIFSIDRSDGANTIYAHTFIVTFTDEYRQRVHRDYLTLSNASNTTNDNLLYAVDLDSSIVQSTVQQTNVRQNGSDQADNKGIIATFKFLSDSQIQVERTHNSESGYLMWEAIDWVGKTLTGVGTNPDPIEDELIVSIEYLEDIEVSDRIKYFELTKGQILENCVPFVSCRPDVGMGGYLYKMLPEVWFEDPSMLYIWRSTSSGKMYYNIQIIEFNPDKVKVQQGKFNFTGTGQTKTIEEVDLSRTFAITYYNYDSSNTSNYYSHCRTSFTNSTQINLQRNSSNGWINAHFYVVEALNDEWTVQTISTSTGGSSQDATISPTDQSRTFYIVSHYTNDSYEWPQRGSIRVYQWTKRRLRMDRGEAANTIYWTAFVVEFSDHTKKYVQHWEPSFGSTSPIYTQNIETLHYGVGWPTTSGCTTIHNTRFPGFFRVNGSDRSDYEGAFGTMRLTSPNSIEIKREVTTCNDTAYGSWNVVDWIGIPYQTYTPQPVSDSIIVSIEIFDFTMEGWRKYLTLTKGQNIDNCVPIMSLKGSGTGGYQYRLMPGITFLEDNRVYLRRFSDSGTLDIYLQIVEFNPSKVRVQSGDYFTTGTVLNRTVSAVDTSRTFIVFYPAFESSASQNYYTMWRAYFTSSTNIEFRRNSSTSYTNIYYYVVESLDDAFDVQWRTQDSSSFSHSTYPSPQITNETVLHGSHYTNDSYEWPQRGFKQLYTDIENNQVVWSRNEAANTIYAKTQVITFNKDVVQKVYKRRYGMGTTTAYSAISLPESPYSVEATVVLPTHAYGITYSTGSDRADYECGFHKQELSTDGTQVYINRTSAETSYGMIQVIEFKLPSYIFGGTITENEVPVDGVIRGYRADTGEFIGETTSSGGVWELFTTHSGAHYVVCLDDEGGFDYNDLIYGRLIPATISG